VLEVEDVEVDVPGLEVENFRGAVDVWGVALDVGLAIDEDGAPELPREAEDDEGAPEPLGKVVLLVGSIGMLPLFDNVSLFGIISVAGTGKFGSTFGSVGVKFKGFMGKDPVLLLIGV
jgi:hypothetical protein